MKFEYLFILVLILFFPLAFSFDRRLELYTRWRPLAASVLAMCAVYWLWDVAATARGHWSFNPLYVTGSWFLGMPLEEWLFFPVLGFVSVFTWEASKHLLERLRRRGEGGESV
jgi:lycopene cyclase domain-containing protein